MSGKKTRGPTKCKKVFTDPDDQTIEFNELGLAIGEKAARFNSFICLEFKKKIPYYKVVKQIDSQKYDDVWEYIKQFWTITDDTTKDVTIKKGKAALRNLRHTLVNDYAREDVSPFQEYDYVDPKHWDDFVLQAKSPESLEISAKAKMSAEKNIDRPRLGQMGYVGLEKFEKDRWEQLVKRYKHLDVMEGELVKRHVVSRAIYNPVTESYDLPNHLFHENGELAGVLHDLHCKETEMQEEGTNDELGNNVVTEVIGKGCQHGGRTRLVSSLLGVKTTLHPRKKKKKS